MESADTKFRSSGSQMQFPLAVSKTPDLTFLDLAAVYFGLVRYLYAVSV